MSERPRAYGYEIRHAGAPDHEAVVRELCAYLAHIGVELDGDGLDHDITAWRREYDGTHGVLLLVVDGSGRAVGTAGVRLLAPGVGELRRMWIRPEHHGQGLGRRLLDACLAEARRLGCRVLRLDSQARFEAALHLYRAHGFSEIGDYNGNPRAEIWMEARL